MNAQTYIDRDLLSRLSNQCGQGLDLANVLLATDEMLQLARAGSWDRVGELERSRHKRLRRCFAQPVHVANSEIFSEALAVMLHLNEELVALLEAAKDDASVRRTDHQFAHEAIGHYLDTKSESV